MTEKSQHNSVLTLSEHNLFRTRLIRYIHTGSLNRRDLVLSILWPQFIRRRNAKIMLQSFGQLYRKQKRLDEKRPLKVAIEPYAGQNLSVRKMVRHLDRHLKDDLYGAYVHGSLGTYEEIRYSDFDALVILKNAVFESAERLGRVAHKLYRATAIMYEFDPLQHHGWFVLTEGDLECYPEAYFPHALFKHAKALLPHQGCQLNISRARENATAFANPFWDLSNSVISRLSHQDYPQNAYQLKGLLSQFMLLPALYLQARDGKGVYKKFSFGGARKDFSSETWAIMDEISQMRADWHYEIAPFQKKFLSSSHFLIRRLARKLSPAIPPESKTRLHPDFYRRMNDLVIAMQEKLKDVAERAYATQALVEHAS